MTLHVTAITPDHIVTASDRLLYAGGSYIRLGDDQYKHLVLSTDDAQVFISFAGFAGIIRNGELCDSTIDWITGVIEKTSRSNKHALSDHVVALGQATQRIQEIHKKYKIGWDSLQQAIFICGWINTIEYGEVPIGIVIDNAIEPNHTWARQARKKVTRRERLYTPDSFKKSPVMLAYLGQDKLAMEQKVNTGLLLASAAWGKPRKIFDRSVKIIKRAATKSKGTIGKSCSGLRLSRGDGGVEVFDHRPGFEGTIVMPNHLISQSKMSVSVTNVRGTVGKQKQQ